jgi:glycosyltransferase involved in cell wall biosynthesis
MIRSLCYVAYSPMDLQSANSIQTFNTLRELSNVLGKRLTTLVPRFGNEPPPPFPVKQLARIPVNKLSRLYQSGRWSYLERSMYAERTKRIIASVNPQLVYTRDIVCAYRFVQAGMPVMYEVHDMESRHPGAGKSAALVETLERMDEETLRGAKGIASLTETFRHELVAMGWQSADRVFVIPDAYDDSVYFPRSKSETRAALNLPQDAKLIIYAGLTFKYRGLDLLLHAFQALGDTNARLVLVGGRDFEVQELRALAGEIGLVERISFVSRQTSNVIAQYLAAADVLVIPDTVTDATASPLKMFEYMAMACPIVSVDRPALREIMGDGALYFPRGDVNAFASALRAGLTTGA